MSDTPVLQRVCNLCGTEIDDASQTNTCTACAKAVGSVVIIPAPTVARVQTQSFPTNPLASRQGIFGDYEILSEIAAGGMGVVYAARQISLNRRVAVKMILTPFARPEQIRRFQAEAENAATLDHPNIIPIYDSGTLNGVPYFAMKLIQGRGLNAELRRLVLEPRKGVAIMATIARAVHYAHQRGILHRDLKPANILIDEQGNPYVGDFGIAKRVGTNDGMTREGAIIGTPYYMAPEQACGISAALTTSADVYGLGAIFYEILTLRAPFHDADPSEILQKVKTAEPITPRKHRANVDRDLETICLKCLEKNPARRYPSAEALALDLDRWMRREPITARPHSMAERAIKWARRRPAVACSAALVLVLAGLVAGFSWHSHELVQRAEAAKIEERRLASAMAVDQGVTALETAKKAIAKSHGRDSDNALIEAEDRFRAALVNLPDNAAATKGLRETALLNFDASLKAKNYRQAREKLLLARSAQLPGAEFEAMLAQLIRQESERGNVIRSRVKALMDDAASLTRRVTPENAVNELITLKDPMTVDLLTKYIEHERPECRAVACAALAWIGDSSIVPLLMPDIEMTTPGGQENPLAVQVAALSAICMLAADDDFGVYEQVKRRIQAEPGDTASVLFNRIKLHFDEFARRQTLRAAEAPGNDLFKLYQRGLQLRDAHAYREALKVFERLVAAEPESATYINARGLVRHELKDLKGALADFDSVVSKYPDQKDGYVNRSNVRTDLHDVAGALDDLNIAVAIAPDDYPLISARGSSRMANGDVAGAMADFEYVLSRKKDELYALTNRGAARATLKDYPGALGDYDRALALSPQFYQALYGRACLRMVMNDVDGSITDFDKVLTLSPNDKTCYYNRAVMRMGKKDYQEAIRDFDHFIELDPAVGVAYYNRGLSHARLGDMKAAEVDYRKAIDLDVTRVDAMVNLGNVIAGKGDYDSAMKVFNRALATDPKKFEAWSARAELHFVLGNRLQALSDKRAALKVLPENASKETREALKQRINILEAAERR